MENKINYTKFFILVIFSFVASCKKDVAVTQDPTPPPTPQAQNLIQNPSFEDSIGNGSLKNWWWYEEYGSPPQIKYNPHFAPADTFGDSINGILYSNDVPSAGGNWSLRVTRGWSDVTLLTFLTNQNGTNIYTLTVHSKKNPYSIIYPPDGIPVIGIDKWSSTSTFPFTSTDTIQQWKSYSYTDTLTTLPTDTIAVYIYMRASQMTLSDFLFDKIELIKTNP